MCGLIIREVTGVSQAAGRTLKSPASLAERPAQPVFPAPWVISTPATGGTFLPWSSALMPLF